MLYLKSIYVMKGLVFALILMQAICLNGQRIKSGDSTVVDSIKKTASWIYENKDETFFFLTKDQLQSLNEVGTSIIAHQKDSLINRIITISMTPNGQMSTEYYFDKEQLIYAYQTFEYFNETAPTGSWKNFKGIPGWESRYYFVDNKLSFQTHKGRKSPTNKEDINNLQLSAPQIISYIKARLH